MKSVIVTGGTGFIGKTLCQKLRQALPVDQKLFAPSSSELDLIHREDALKWFERLHWTNEVTHIFHLAAVYKAGGWPMTHPGTQFHANMQINLSVLEGWKRFFPKARLTSVVSYCMYPDHDRPHPEEELWGTEPEPYLFSYAFTKKALLIGQRAYSQEFGLDASALVLPTVYGPEADFSELSHVIGALIGKFTRACEANQDTVEVWGDGSQIREFIHVEDVADALLLASNSEIQSDTLNLGSAAGVITIRALAEKIAAITGFKGNIRYNTDKFVGAPTRTLDCAKIKRELSWKPKVDFEQGLRTSVEAYRRSISNSLQS
ncbi:MAG: NAD-dependent epimerase/dehydratase family protein [Coraliomargarita sp.]